ncbi:hypothetical protein DCAR_0831766 [Daucus carota subsp. sativus]|uniref:Sulfate transporter n=1 Tax=Daucus carota subsp. sativus TaxID=79200 RepID=A0AAF0XT01_DAUCS|nr:hypothetical protein DCAR_0831766 [Daucus carota subsp. sativus]
MESSSQTSTIPTKPVAGKLKTSLIFWSKWTELNGAMGDLGPIIMVLTFAKDLNLGKTLVFTSIFNIITGAIYGVLMPVQPMKSIAAVAVFTPEFGIPEIMAAEIYMAAILFLLGIIPLPVVRGVQLAQGLLFAMTAVDLNLVGTGVRPWIGLDGIILALVCAFFYYYCYCFSSAFIIFLLGVILAFIRGPEVVKDIAFCPSSLELICKLSSDIFPSKDVSVISVSISVGMMNLVECWFGAMPSCHGARGYGGCVALLGAAKLALGFLLSGSLVKILNQFPVGVLGVLLLFAGIELALCCRDMNTKEDSFVMLLCTAVSSAAVGFVCGLVVYLLLKFRKLGKNQPQSSVH